MSVILAGTCLAQSPYGPVKPDSYMRVLVGRRDVQAELMLISGQLPRLNALPQLSPPFDDKQVETSNAAIRLILNPYQMRRLAEIQIQLQGIFSISRTDVQDAIGMTPQQRSTVKGLDFSYTNMVSGADRGSANIHTGEDLYGSVWALKLRAVLTKAQYRKLGDVSGEPFTFASASR